MSIDSKSYIRNKMLEKSTDELVEIWVENDRTEWSDLAFEVIGEILRQRLGNLPEQEQVEAEEDETYFDRDRLFKISDRANLISWIVLAIMAVYICLGGLYALVSSFGFANFLPALASIAVVAILGLSCFALLRTISEVIYIMADVEDNTRRAAKALEKNTME